MMSTTTETAAEEEPHLVRLRQRRREQQQQQRATNSSNDVNTTNNNNGDKKKKENKNSSKTTTTNGIHLNKNNNKDKTLLEKLFSSKEETTAIIPHIHKILGFSCLGSFAYRLYHLGGEEDCNFGPNIGTLLFVVHHFLLNLTSFVFVIPAKRIRDGGYRIWPEYRIHSLVFASRNLAFILLRWYEQTQNIPASSKRNLWYMDTIIVLATCGFADLGSWIQGQNHSDTVRGATFSDPFEQWFASQMQIFLTSFCLIGYRRYTVHLLALCIIQVNSFLMTLRRKNVAGHYTLTATYTLMLVVGFIAIGCDDKYSHRVGVAATYGGVATILRMGPLRVNKYLLWSGLGLVHWYIRTNRILPFYNSMFWLKAQCTCQIICTLLGWHKRSKFPPESKNPIIGYLVFLFHFGVFSWICILNNFHNQFLSWLVSNINNKTT